MNGVHDIGGMHGMGPIEHEKNEAVFHTRGRTRIATLRTASRFFSAPDYAAILVSTSTTGCSSPKSYNAHAARRSYR
jgi:hypothetical protein